MMKTSDIIFYCTYLLDSMKQIQNRTIREKEFPLRQIQRVS